MTTRTWNGATASFTTAGDWSGNAVPVFGDTAIIPAGIVQFTGASNGIAFELGDTMSSGGPLPTLAVTNGSFGSSTSISDIAGGGTFQVTVNGTLTNSGAILVTNFGSVGLINNAAGTSSTFTQSGGSITVANGELDINTANVQLNGGVAVSGGTFAVDNFNPNQTAVALMGNSSIQIEAGGVFEDFAQSTSGVDVLFGDNTNDTFVVGGAFSGIVSGFDFNNILDFLQVPAATGASFANGVLTVTNNGAQVAQITLTGPSVTSSTTFLVSQDGSGGIDVTIACFAAGTMIRTPDGETAVEHLTPGDMVCTLDGAAPVTWIGHRRIDTRHYASPNAVIPVRIEADAFAPGEPAEPLLLSPEHAVFVDDVMIPARALVNGRTISRVWRTTVDYYHVELPSHAVIAANGLPVESWLDTGNRAMFANAGPVVALHAISAATAWSEAAYAPLHETGAVVDAVRDRLEARADRLGIEAAPELARRLLSA